MGESAFYLKAEFKDEKATKRAFVIAQEVFKELAKMHDDWQKMRDEGRRVKERHKELLEKYPLVARLIELPKPILDDKSMNYLAGHLEISEDFEMERGGKKIFLQDTVWHLGSWDNIQNLFFKLGAMRCGWLNSENGTLIDIGKENFMIKNKRRSLSAEELDKLAVLCGL